MEESAAPCGGVAAPALCLASAAGGLLFLLPQSSSVATVLLPTTLALALGPVIGAGLVGALAGLGIKF